LAGQGATDYSKIIGDWDIEIDAGEEFYYLTMTISATDGSLAGVISEDSGYFSDVEMEEIEFDGKILSFVFTAPTPPDGTDKAIRVEFEVSNDDMTGFLSIEDLDMTVPVTATRTVE
jgi:hypothetical protein